MKRMFLGIALGLAAAPAQAQLVSVEGSGAWCAGYDETFDGVWFFPDGQEALLFRIGVSGDTGCYAWLNAVEPWGLEPGYAATEAATGAEGISLPFPSGVEVVLFASGRAEHRRNGFITIGELRN